MSTNKLFDVSSYFMSMATRNTTDGKIDKGCTDFVLHKSQQTIFSGIQNKIIDYSEHRLLKYIAKVTDPQQKLVLAAMVGEYRVGNIAIAWRRGQPTYIKVTKNA